MFTRRNFILTGLTAAGLKVTGSLPAFGFGCPVESINSPGPILLNDLLVYYQQEHLKYGHGLNKVTVCDKGSWQEKSNNILQRSKIMLGESPEDTGFDIKPDIIDETQRNGYKELKVEFPSGTGDVIKGYLLVPECNMASSSCPGIIAMHSTTSGASKDTVEPSVMKGSQRNYGMELAQRGYVVLAIDVISAGERTYPGYSNYDTTEIYKEYPHWSAMGKMVYDHKKCVDYLCSLDIVDPARLGCIGHSLGGYNSFFLHALDPRIKAAVSSCGLSPMGGTNVPYQFARDAWFVHFNPRCSEFIRAGMIPCDMHEIMALCAPRPLFNYSAKQDGIYFPRSVQNNDGFTKWWQTTDEALSQVSKIYEILGVPGNFVRIEDNGGHDFPLNIREEAYRWFDKMLGLA